MKNRQTPKITVAIRKRPLNKKEIQKGQTDIIKVGDTGAVLVSEYKQKVDLTKYIEETTFNFDYSYHEDCTNEDIYEQSIRPLINNAFMGAKISCFAYGQTGSGKTFTMKGDTAKGVPGLYYLGAREIFNYLRHPEFSHLKVAVSFFEIYCGKLYDLLNDRFQLKIREDKKQNINIIGIEEKPIYSAEQFLEIIEYGSNFRVTSQNATNADSSRSHAILQIIIKNEKKNFSKISFIDLAGNERGADHMDQSKQTKIDGAEINKSLLSLKECIRALDQGKDHVPFRGSKLTMVLKDSFVGFCKTVMIANVSPNVSASENSMNTLRYADRVKQLKKGEQNLSKQEMHSKEMMLPRTYKNSIKVNIDNNDDSQDIMAKVENAKRINSKKEEEKMDIEEQVRRPVIPMGRKTQNSNEIRSLADKKPALSRQHKSGFEAPTKGFDFVRRQSQKEPLLSRNVPQYQIDQNNLNFVNCNQNDPFQEPKRNMLNIQQKGMSQSQSRSNIEPLQFNRNHFDVMNRLREDFVQYKEDHECLVRNQMASIKNQISMKDALKKNEVGDNCQEEINHIDNYLDSVQRSIQEKMDIYSDMKRNLQNFRSVVREANQINQQATFQPYQPPFQHQQQVPFPQNNFPFPQGNNFQVNKIHENVRFNHVNQGFNNHQFGDQQLLEGLPEDESMPRLF